MAPDRLALAKARPERAAEDKSSAAVLGTAGVGMSWGGGIGAPDLKPDPVRTRWVDAPPPSYSEALSLLSIDSLQQQQHTAPASTAAVLYSCTYQVDSCT